jgi:RNA polymerase sigma-70 factor, ECF subfamily
VRNSDARALGHFARNCDRSSPREGLWHVTPTDSEVIARVLAGDVDAYGILVERYQRRFTRFATRMLGNREDAEEALQDAFLRAYRALARYQDRQRFGPWFYRILVNRCRSMLAQRRRRGLVDRDVSREEPVEATRPDGDPAWLLSQLPVEQREVFLLRYVEDLSFQDIAALTGVGVSALKMRVKRGLERLRELHKEQRHG